MTREEILSELAKLAPRAWCAEWNGSDFIADGLCKYDYCNPLGWDVYHALLTQWCKNKIVNLGYSVQSITSKNDITVFLMKYGEDDDCFKGDEEWEAVALALIHALSREAVV